MQQKFRTDTDVRGTYQKQVFVKKLVGKKLTRTSISCRASLLCEKGRIHFYRDKTEYSGYGSNQNTDGHYVDNLQVLEDELCNWQPGDDSPDRMDAFVHGINFLKPDATNTVQDTALRSAFAQSVNRG